MRNALAYAGKGQRQMVVAMINTVFAQETAEGAHQQWRAVAAQLGEGHDQVDRHRIALSKGSFSKPR